MRICVSGTGGQGKSVFISDFIKQWPEYSTPKSTYREYIGDTHSKKTTKDVQWKILNTIIDEIQKHGKDDKVIYDRGPLDSIVYTLWSNVKGVGGVDDEFVSKCIPLVRESMKLLDIILFIPITKASKVDHNTDKFSAYKSKNIIDDNFIIEIDNLFKALKYDWDVNASSKIFDPKDKPAVIEIFGQPNERIQMMKMYINEQGELIDDVGVMSADSINELEGIKHQFGVHDDISKMYNNPKGNKRGYE